MSIVLHAPGSTPPDGPVEGVVGIVVTYRPPPDFDRVLESIVSQVPLTIVVSNDDDPVFIERVRRWIADVSHDAGGRQHGSVSLLLNGQNRGLSVAFNQGVAVARSSGPRFVVLLDQDTHLHPGAVRTLADDYRELSVASSPGAVGCTNVEGVRVSGFPLGALDRVRRMYHLGPRAAGPAPPSGSVEERATMVNSGTMMATATLESVGLFDEDLFIDAIDYDYSFRLRQLRLRIFCSARALADHRIGAPFETRWFGRTVQLRTYSTARSYYIVRDTGRLMAKWFAAFPVEVFGIGTRMLIGVVGSLAVLPDRRARAGAILAGLRDIGTPESRPRP